MEIWEKTICLLVIIINQSFQTALEGIDSPADQQSLSKTALSFRSEDFVQARPSLSTRCVRQLVHNQNSTPVQ